MALGGEGTPSASRTEPGHHRPVVVHADEQDRDRAADEPASCSSGNRNRDAQIAVLSAGRLVA